MKKVKLGSHPIYGMAGTKPRLAAEPELDPDAPKNARERFEANSKLDREYKIRRNRILKLKEPREGMKLAIERDQLILRSRVEQQLGFLLAAVRSRMLAIPPNIGARLGKEAADIAREKVYEALREMAELPATLTKVEWEAWLAKEEGDKKEG